MSILDKLSPELNAIRDEYKLVSSALATVTRGQVLDAAHKFADKTKEELTKLAAELYAKLEAELAEYRPKLHELVEVPEHLLGVAAEELGTKLLDLLVEYSVVKAKLKLEIRQVQAAIDSQLTAENAKKLWDKLGEAERAALQRIMVPGVETQSAVGTPK